MNQTRAVRRTSATTLVAQATDVADAPYDHGNRRILVIDDSAAIRDDFRKILAPPVSDPDLDDMEAAIFGGAVVQRLEGFELEVAAQGELGYNCVVEACAAGRPYAIAFVDIRMPPGWDGVETATRILAHDRDIQVVICTAFSDYSWSELREKVGQTDRVLILKKPFEDVEVLQLVDSMSAKWTLASQRRRHVADLERAVRERTAELVESNRKLSADIVERERAEAALQLSERRFRVLATHAPVGIFETDIAGSCCFVNESWCQATGLSVAEAMGDGWASSIHDDDRERVGADLHAAIREGRKFAHEFRFHDRRGDRIVWVVSVAVPIRDAAGAIIGFLGTTTDVTERKRADAQLVLSDRMASLGTLAAGVAHEINNPLSYVTTNLEMIGEELRILEQEKTSPIFRELLDMVADARGGAERVRKIVHGIKAFSHGDQDRRAILELRPLLDLSVDMTFNEIRHRARIVKDYGDVPPIEADEARLGQVFINLLINAAHALPEGQPELHRVEISTTTDDRGRAVIEIRDNGRGMPPAVLKHIFDPFFTTKPVGEGTGLGLSICHGIISDLGGEITATSEVGKGSVFRVVVPPADLPTAVATKTEVDDVPHTPRARRTPVLVVDDDEGVRVSMSRVLREHDVRIVGGAHEALELLRAGSRYDVIFCDLMMPIMTGMALHAELARTCPEQADRMVFVTGGAFTPDGRAFLDTVSNDRVEKPIESRNLRALVQRMTIEKD